MLQFRIIVVIVACKLAASDLVQGQHHQRLRANIFNEPTDAAEYLFDTSNADAAVDNSTDFCQSIVAVAGTKLPDYYDDTSRALQATEDFEETFLCEFSDGQSIPLEGTSEQIATLRHQLHRGQLISSESTFDMPNANFRTVGRGYGRRLEIPAGEKVVVKSRGRNGRNNGGRDLAVLEGNKPVLAVRVIDSKNAVIADSAATISDKIFGTYGDSATMTSQFAACSMGKLNIINDYGKSNNDKWKDIMVAPGVIEVKIDVEFKNKKATVRNAVTAAVQKKLGITLPGPFQQVMYVLKECTYPGDCGWAAYA